MPTLLALWLPILLSAVSVFVAASLVWMLLPHHRNDWSKASDEGKLLSEIKAQGIGPGIYFLPHHGGGQNRNNPEFQEALRTGSAVFMQIWPGKRVLNMSTSLVQTFLFYLCVSTAVALLATQVLPIGTAYMTVFRVTAIAASLAYAAGHIPKAIHWGYTWSMVLKEVFDGILYGLVTAGVFGWLWP